MLTPRPAIARPLFAWHSPGKFPVAGRAFGCIRAWRRLAPLVVLAVLPIPVLAQQVSVQIHWKHQFEFAAFYAAEAQGYYRDAGLEVVIREGGPGIDAVK
jgi:ABC-type nitrate/sulfonate/bicarbonate transport system substrate-binding protein